MGKYKKILLLSIKITFGSCLAIYIAQAMRLDYAISAGTITLLTLMNSKWESIKLSVCRLATFTITLLSAELIFTNIQSIWIAYGCLLFIVVFLAEILEWRATISVNAVIAAHLITGRDFGDAAIRNEFLLVLIGIVLAVIVNLFHANFSHKKEIIGDMRAVEHRMQLILSQLAAYLSKKEMPENILDDLCMLERDVRNCVRNAYEYQDNTFHSHPEYYIFYFEMRREQCQILCRLYYEMKKIHSMPVQADNIAEYISYLAGFVIEINEPDAQLKRLDGLLSDIRRQKLPETREEFESRAMLFHIIMDMEEFLMCKKTFADQLNEQQLRWYWGRK